MTRGRRRRSARLTRTDRSVLRPALASRAKRQRVRRASEYRVQAKGTVRVTAACRAAVRRSSCEAVVAHEQHVAIGVDVEARSSGPRPGIPRRRIAPRTSAGLTWTTSSRCRDGILSHLGIRELRAQRSIRQAAPRARPHAAGASPRCKSAAKLSAWRAASRSRSVAGGRSWMTSGSWSTPLHAASGVTTHMSAAQQSRATDLERTGDAAAIALKGTRGSGAWRVSP